MQDGISMRRAIAYLGILVALAACGLGEALQDYGDPVDLTPQTLAGTWRSGTDPRLITFTEDGTFTATDLPYEIFDDVLPPSFDPLRDRVDGTGTWELKAGSDGRRTGATGSSRRTGSPSTGGGTTTRSHRSWCTPTM